eukprot:CAMPEP_0195254148 /NCGR_PEP_ID=MMETSP0706-20130129/4889_1 /TAXON_ID=33640 /ORGANISM="Asterionellopsis glacialis, Strain CCMP134" /LENGTH=257 /DNA_ID=CAMNT_0040306787 /DNA_START=818 /DNA_END=1591 /DNA_ORIENTATION=+
MDVVMREGETIFGMDEGEFPTYRNGKCTVRFSKNGNFATQNGFLVGGWDANQNSRCAVWQNPPTARYNLIGDGNFVIYCDGHLDYSSHTQGDEDAQYFMAIDDECVLHILKGSFTCDSVSVEEEVWKNIRTDPLKPGDRMGQGEYVLDKATGNRLVLQSSDGNLVLRGPNFETLWAANQEGAPLGQYDQYYLTVHSNDHGTITLVGIDYQYGEETIYFEKDFGATNGACYTVEYDSNAMDLIAVPCDGRRDRKLRGA